MPEPRPVEALPDARELLPELVRACRESRLLPMFDYDGTLTPIVSRPEEALIPVDVREALVRLARAAPVAILSGRDLEDVRARVGIDGIWYAGSHGFEILGPGGERVDMGADFAEELARATDDLRRLAAEFPGAWVDRKRYAVALHWRAVPDRHAEAIEERVRSLLRRHPQLELKGGKRVFELRPASGWHKGKAARWLIERLGARDHTVLFVGDDVTDEDAFEELAGEARTVVVCEGGRRTAAGWRLRDTADVARFLRDLADACTGTAPATGDVQVNDRSAR